MSLAVAACSNSGSGGPGGQGGAGGGRGGGAGGGAVGGGAGEMAGGGGTGGGAGGGATGAGGAAGAAGAAGGAGGGSAGSGGSSSGDAGTDAHPPCSPRVLSLSANGTGTDSDAAYSRVVIDLMTALPIGNANRTLEFWAFIKTTDWVGERNELFEYGGTGTAASFGLDFGTNAVTGMAGNHATLNPFTGGGAFTDDSTAYLGITSTSDQWVHIAMTWDGTALRTYVNGAIGITTNATGGTTALATAQSTVTIGCNFQNMNCFNGLLDELRIWNVARSAAQISASYNRTLVGDEAGLVGYWKFDDAPGSTTAADSVGGGRTAHPGALMANTGSPRPTFVTPPTPPPLTCP